MKVVAAPDSFKGSLSATAAASAIAAGVRAAAPNADVHEIPIADGGEGTVDALVRAARGRLVDTEVLDPLGRPVTARYGLINGDSTAVIEMAAASGLPLLSQEERNPLLASTFGTGQLILDAARRGVRSIILGIGGSATVDGGAGMARALGIRLLDSASRPLEGRGLDLNLIAHIDKSALHPSLSGISVTVACDVTNPLTGPKGAAPVYGPQKGATPDMVASLDKGLANLASCIRRDLGIDVESLEGGGAAGGRGAGLVAFLGARLERGVKIVLDAVDLPAGLLGAHLVLTGEGKVDSQSVFGKAVAGVAAAAKQRNIPCVVLAGGIAEGADALLDIGVTALFSISDGPSDEKYMTAHAAPLLERAACNVTRLFLSGNLAKGPEQ